MKKMRKLIPAFAMLMVAAIMMTTASFAWFSMNDQVKVSGLQIKAEATGSLIISNAPIHANALGSNGMNFDEGVKNFKPMTYSDVQVGPEDATKDLGWAQPAEDDLADFNTGAVKNDLVAMTENAAKALWIEKAFYIATSGEQMIGKKLQITLTAPSVPSGLGEAHKAYAAAIYYITPEIEVEVEGETEKQANPVWAADGKLDWNAVPDEIIHIDTATSTNTFTLNGVTIPSVAGAVDEDTAVGLKVFVRFFVDGALESNIEIPVMRGNKYTAAAGAAYDAARNYVVGEYDEVELDEGADLSAYYTANDDANPTAFTPASGKKAADDDKTYYTFVTSPAIADESVIESATVPAGWYTYAANMVNEPYTYIRSAQVPSAGVALELAFKAVD